MFVKMSFFVCALIAAVHVFLPAQTHLSVPLGHPVYEVIEQAQMRGLLRHLPSARPFTRAQVLSFLDEILHSDAELRFGRLTDAERGIIRRFQQDLAPSFSGFDRTRGTLSFENENNAVRFSGQLGFGFNLDFSGSVFPIAGGFQGPPPPDDDDELPDFFAGANHPASGDTFAATDFNFNFYFAGDIGRNFTYSLAFGVSLLRAPRAILGTANTFSHGWEYRSNDFESSAHYNRRIFILSDSLSHFPFTFRKNWDGSVFYLDNVGAGGFQPWPQRFAIGYTMMPEMAGSAFNGHLTYRVARIQREWAGMSSGSSLVFNEFAQPFLAAEMTLVPFNWLAISALAGRLEFSPTVLTDPENLGGQKIAAEVFQNNFSVVMAEFNWRYFHAGIGSAVVWANRFEFGYLFPFIDNFLYQQVIGDFDNFGAFLNLQGRFPGLGKLWFSLFVDEVSPADISGDFFNMTRMMYAHQVGLSVSLPWLSRIPFNTLTIGYTRVQPFTYTHTRENLPWYGNLAMETNWVNAGRPLGHYLPPNSDELLVRFSAIPLPGSTVSFQYQLVRHGASYGDRAVGGSSHWSELSPRARNAMRSFFLRDGAYRWMHIFRLGGSYSFTSSNLPISVFAEIGAVYSFFTDIEGPVNPDRPGQFRRINTPQYPRQLSFIGMLGVRIFPKW